MQRLTRHAWSFRIASARRLHFIPACLHACHIEVDERREMFLLCSKEMRCWTLKVLCSIQQTCFHLAQYLTVQKLETPAILLAGAHWLRCGRGEVFGVGPHEICPLAFEWNFVPIRRLRLNAIDMIELAVSSDVHFSYCTCLRCVTIPMPMHLAALGGLSHPRVHRGAPSCLRASKAFIYDSLQTHGLCKFGHVGSSSPVPVKPVRC